MNSNNKTLQGLKKVNDRLLGIEIFLLALITILLVAAIFIEVVCRYFLFISAAWAEEFTRYLFIWLTYIGSAYAICDNSHTEIDVLKQVLMKIKGPAAKSGSRRWKLQPSFPLLHFWSSLPSSFSTI